MLIIDGEKTKDMNEKQLTEYRRKHLGYVFQMYNLIPNLTVKENIEVGAFLSDKPLEIEELLKTLGLYEHKNKLPNQLSGGQQQRTAIGSSRFHGRSGGGEISEDRSHLHGKSCLLQILRLWCEKRYRDI